MSLRLVAAAAVLASAYVHLEEWLDGWGLFGDHETWHGPYVWTATVVEVVAIVAGSCAVLVELPPTPARAQRSHLVS